MYQTIYQTSLEELAASSNSNSVTNQWVILGKVLHLFLSQSLSSKNEGISVYKLLMWPHWECRFCFHCCYSIEVVSETGNITVFTTKFDTESDIIFIQIAITKLIIKDKWFRPSFLPPRGKHFWLFYLSTSILAFIYLTNMILFYFLFIILRQFPIICSWRIRF